MNMEKINGIIIEGKVYEAVQGECKNCDLQEQRNWEFYKVKGIYFIMGQPVKNWPTPKQLSKWLKREIRLPLLRTQREERQ